MPAAARKDLYLSVDGGVTSAFTAAMKAGRSTLADFGKSADLSAQAVRDAFTKLGGGDIANAAKEMEAQFNSAFASIRANARKVADAPTNIAAFDILSAQATREAVGNAETRVAALREVARAAQAAASGDASGGQRAFAVAAEANVAAAERVLASEKARLDVLEAVEAQMRANGLTTREQAEAEAAAAMRRQAIVVEEAAEQAKLVDRSETLLRSIDPLYAAEARFKDAIAEANALREAGVLIEERYAEAVNAATAARDKVANAPEIDAKAAAQANADRAEQLLRSVNPLYAAQQRYQEMLKLTAELEGAGSLTAARATEVRTDALAKLNAVNDAGVRAANAEAEAQAFREATVAYEMFEAKVREGAQAMREQEAETQRLDRAAASLRASIVSTLPAEEQLNLAMAEARELIGRGAITLDEYCAKLRLVRARLDEGTEATNQHAAGHSRMGASGMIAEHVVRSLSDSVAAGQSPMRALGMEIGRISEAMTLWAATTNAEEGVLGRLAGFMGGPWGIAISVGVAVLTPLIGKLFEAGEEAEKAKKALQEYGSFMDELGNFVDRATGKIIEQNRALAEGARLRKESQAHDAATETGRLRDQAFDTARAVADPGVYGSASVRYGISQALANGADPSKYQDARVQKVLLDAEAQPSRRLEVLVNELKVLAAEDPKKYEDLYRRVLDQATQARKSYSDYKDDRGQAGEITTVLGGGTVLSKELIDDRVREREATDALSRAEAHLTAVRHEGDIAAKRPAGPERDAALAQYEKDLTVATEAVNRLKQAKKDATANREVGRDPSFDEVKQIIEGIGGHVTSTMRTREQQQTLYDKYMAYKQGRGPWAPLAAKPGSSLHEAGNGVAVDFTGVSLGAARKALSDRGIRVSEALIEGNHDHIGIRKRGGAGPSQETIDKRDLAAKDKATRDAEAYTQLRDRGNEELLQLQRQQIFDVRQAADLDVQQVQSERDRANARAQAGADERKWTQAQADELIATNRGIAALKIVAIQRAEGQKLLDQQLEVDRAALERGSRLLQLQSDLAVTNEQRHRIALQLLKQEEDNARLEANRKLGSDDPRVRAQGALDLKQVDDEHGYRVQQVDRQYADPVSKYKLSLQENVGDMNEALKGVEGDGLKGLEDGLIGVISGTKSVAGAFKEMAASIISDIARIAVEKLILSFIGLKDGGAVPLKLAGGGPIFGEGGPRDDKVPALLSHGEYVVNAEAYARHPALVQAINTGRLPKFADGGAVGSIFYPELPSAASVARAMPPPQVIYVKVDKADLFDVHVQRAAAPLAQAAMIGGARQAQQDMADVSMARIPT